MITNDIDSEFLNQLTTELDRQVRVMRENLFDAFSGLSVSVAETVRAFEEFGNNIDQVAEAEYLHYHAKLPGGTSSARLLKKRRKIVMQWFEQHIAGHFS